MRSRANEVMLSLFWMADLLYRPTTILVAGSFESWIHRHGYHRQFNDAKRKKYLEVSDRTSRELKGLTPSARVLAMGKRDPVACWNRPWDGQFRFLVFDLPRDQPTQRQRLLRFLRALHFGYLQDSLWIHPAPPDDILPHLETLGGDVELIVQVHGPFIPPAKTGEVVQRSWNFEAINRRYRKHLDFLEAKQKLSTELGRSQGPESPATQGRSNHAWLRTENSLWLEAVSSDPLLPEVLLPAGYLGKQAWTVRNTVMPEIVRHSILPF